jgi:murein DD-endopeptidase MepM/ murein hydrolase activator NlpD
LALVTVSTGSGHSIETRAQLTKVVPLHLATEVHRGVLRQGETLSTLLGRLGVPAADVSSWLSAAGSELALRSLPVGLVVEVETRFPGQIRALRLTPDWRTTVVVEASGDGLVARREARPVDRQLVVLRGELHSSLFEAVSACGGNDTLAVALADLFAWDVDFHREVRDGDSFALLVERIASDGKTVAYGPILAATYTNQGRRLAAVRYAPPASAPSYYDERGRPLRKQFLRAPLRFSRVTSRYSLSRLHPILGIRMPHWGVDYGAPVGTPVMVTADGVVVSAGWHDGGGKAVAVRHAGGFVTTYMHLSRFAAGIVPGRRVEQGQVIGYVGATGLATGPHLDYRVTQNGRHVNPMSIGRKPAPPLPAASLPGFLAWAEKTLRLLNVSGPLDAERSAAVEAAAPVPVHG